MIGISTAANVGIHHKLSDQTIKNNNFEAKDCGHSYIQKGAECSSPHPVKENGTKNFKRTISQYSSIPFMGIINWLQENKVKQTSKVSVESIFEDTAVITVNNKSAAVLMGGCEKTVAGTKLEENFLHFTGLVGTEDPFGKLSTRKTELSLSLAIMLGSSYMLSTLIPSTLAGLTAVYLTDKVFQCFGNNPVKSVLEIGNLKGTYLTNLIESTYIPIPLIGLDTSAMREKAQEIKEKYDYNFFLSNCSWAVLECIKAGLPDEVVKKLPLPGLFTTPTDVENIIAFLIENEYVISGEVDEDGVAWFDARTDLD